jgi:hypothetical protein
MKWLNDSDYRIVPKTKNWYDLESCFDQVTNDEKNSKRKIKNNWINKAAFRAASF